MTNTEQYTAVAAQLRSATERSTELWKQGAQALTQQADVFSARPLDPTAGVERYFDLLQKAVDVNRDLATKWAEAVTSMTQTLTSQVGSVRELATKQVTAVADLVADQAGKAEQIAQEQAERAEEEAKAEARRERAAERAKAKETEDRVREAYSGQTKAELSDKLAERDLPRTGNLDELVNRLVEDDLNK